LISKVLLRRLPGSGTSILQTSMAYRVSIRVGDQLTATVTVRAKLDGERVEFACRCVNQAQQVLAEGSAVVAAPTSRIARRRSRRSRCRR